MHNVPVIFFRMNTEITTQAKHPRWVDFLFGIIVFSLLSLVVMLLVSQNKIFQNEVRWLNIKYERLFTANGQLRRELAHAQDACSLEECLVREGKYGIASAKGYLVSKNDDCPTIVLRKPSDSIASAFGTGAIAVSTVLLSEDENKMLAASSGSNIVSFILLQSSEKETGKQCISSVDILEVR